jgi:hypothetical protein
MKKTGQRVAAAALLCGLAFSGYNIPQVAAQPDSAALETVRFVHSVDAATAETAEVREAVSNFIRGMAEGDAETVWMYASEEEQMAFETEAATLAAYAAEFPALTKAQEVSIQSYRDEGDTPFVELSMRDADGNAYQASVGLWLDDAGDWKVVSLDVNAVTDQVASL